MKKYLGGLLIGVFAGASVHAAEVMTVRSVDLERYMGTWYEQANLPMYFQRNCEKNTAARYSLREDGRVDVFNTCETANGQSISARGVARKVGGSTAKLEVRFAPAWLSFLPMVWGDYWIIGLDNDYKWSVVGSPDRKYLWILTRDKNISDQKYQSLVDLASAQGFDTRKLVRTKQQ